jgi:hypothetical protein
MASCIASRGHKAVQESSETALVDGVWRLSVSLTNRTWSGTHAFAAAAVSCIQKGKGRSA